MKLMPADGLIVAHLLSVIDCITLYCLIVYLQKTERGI